MVAEQHQIRGATTADRPAIIRLCERSLDWRSSDPNEEFFSWKHDANPWGESPTWVATTSDGEIVGLRTFVNWRFVTDDGRTLRAVRAVDTATDPSHQGKGIFAALTLGALPELAAMGTDFIFNTPNDRSRPGYLKVGWNEAGRVPAAVRIGRLKSIRRTARSRAAADLWSLECSVGTSAIEAFESPGAVAHLLGRRDLSHCTRTDIDIDHLRWRYGFAPLKYRHMRVGADPADGGFVFRLRRRGQSIEMVLALPLFDPSIPRRVRRSSIRKALRLSGADYAITTGSAFASRLDALGHGFVSVPSLGPVLTVRGLSEFPGGSALVPPRNFAFALGDIELF